MSQTKPQKRKQQKKTVRNKNWRKHRNAQHNAAPKKWRLDVFYKGCWNIGFKEFSKWTHVEKFRDETEALRKKGAEVIPGRVVSLMTGKVVLEIKPSAKEADPKALGDKMAGPDAAKAGGKKGILERMGLK